MNKKRVLVVDDLPDWRFTLHGLLSDQGFFVETADSVQTALDAIKKSDFELVIIDIRLDEADEGNVDGLNLAFEIKKTKHQVKIIIMTGYASITHVKKALEPNSKGESLAVYFIEKSDIDELVNACHQLFSIKK